MRRLLAFLVSGAILVAIYLQINVDSLIETLEDTNLWRLAASLLLLIVLVFLSALRLTLLAHTAELQLGGRMAVKATFAANALNLFLPGKLGDLAKASLMRDKVSNSVLPGLRVCIYEKLSDVLAILSCGGLALAFYQSGDLIQLLFVSVSALGLLICMTMAWVPELLHSLLRLIAPRLDRIFQPVLSSWADVVRTLTRQPLKLSLTLLFTLLIWAGHFLQIAMMAWALGVTKSWLELMSLFPIMILAGLLPITIAGIGPRDAAIVVLTGPLIGYPVAAALGVLFWLRYLVPGIIGLVFVYDFVKSIKSN